MNPLASCKVAIAALKVNALRSFLAMLGVIIGVASVIVMVSVATGAGQAIEERIAALGTNLLIISPGSFTSGGRRAGEGTAIALSEGDLDMIRAKVPGVAAVAGTIQGSAPLVAGASNWTTQVNGVNEDYLEVRDWPLTEGRNFTEAELRAGAKVAILGATTARELFGSAAALGQQIRVMNVPFTVIGLLSVKGQSGWGSDQDDTALVPISTARRRLFGAEQTVPDNLRQIMVEIVIGRGDGRGAGRDRDFAARAAARARRCARRFPRARHGRLHPHAHRDAKHSERAARRHRRDFAGGGRHRHYEHHAGVGDRAHAGDRPAHGGRRAAARYSLPVPDRGGDAVRGRRADRPADRRRRGAGHVDLGQLADRAIARPRA